MGWGDYSDLLVKLRSLCMLMQKMRVFLLNVFPQRVAIGSNLRQEGLHGRENLMNL